MMLQSRAVLIPPVYSQLHGLVVAFGWPSLRKLRPPAEKRAMTQAQRSARRSLALGLALAEW